MIRALLIMSALAATALPVAAEPWSCNFTAECIAGEPCEQTDWDLDIIAADHEGQLFASSIFGDAIVNRISPAQSSPMAYAGADQLITIAETGTATLSTHAGIAITYFGNCEVLE